MQQAIIAQMCNPNAAYAQGVNDAKNSVDMKYDYAGWYSCPYSNAAINAAYQQGYQFGLIAVNEGANINIYTKHHHYLTAKSPAN